MQTNKVTARAQIKRERDDEGSHDSLSADASQSTPKRVSSKTINQPGVRTHHRDSASKVCLAIPVISNLNPFLPNLLPIINPFSLETQEQGH